VNSAVPDATPRQRLPEPSPWLVVVLLLWGALGVAASFGWFPARIWQLAGVNLLLVAGFDLLWLLRRSTPKVTREVSEILPVGVPGEVRLQLHATGRARQWLDVYDHHPGGWNTDGLPRRVGLRAGEMTALAYTIHPDTRGEFAFGQTDVRLLSPLWLWRHRRQAGTAQRVRIFPHLAPLARFALISTEHASRLVGAHLKRRRGEGTDFHQMREYRVGDSLRQIDWKASRRARKLISREYQDERNQQLLLVLDTGRRMLARDGELSHFDHALNACLLLAYLALRQGDGVGLFATGGEQRWVRPKRGMGAIQTLLDTSYDLQPAAVATDYLALATELSRRQRRRALLILVTNLRDEDIDDVLVSVRVLQRRHLVVVASLRERALDEVLGAPVDTLKDAIRAGATARYLAQRRAAHDILRQHHVSVLDVTAEQLPGALVEHYLTIKRAGVL